MSKTISQSDMAREVGQHVFKVNAFRRKNLVEGEGWLKGENGILLTEQGAGEVRSHFVGDDSGVGPSSSPELPTAQEPEVQTLARVLQVAKNPKWVFADVEGKKVEVLVGKSHWARKGRKFYVKWDPTGGPRRDGVWVPAERIR